MILLTMESVKMFLESEMAKRGWNQAELARRSGIDSGWISNLINGNRSLGFTSLLGLSKGLGVTPDYILRATGYLPKLSSTEAQKDELLTLFEQLEEEQRADLMFYIQFLLKKQLS